MNGDKEPLTTEELEALTLALRERCQDTEAAEDVEIMVQMIELLADGVRRDKDTIHFYIMARRQMEILDTLVEGIERGDLRAVLPEGASGEHLKDYRMEHVERQG